MPIDEFIIAVFCCLETFMRGRTGLGPLRQRGFAPHLTDSEVLTMEIVGEVLGLDTDKQIWRYFRQHWSAWFPRLGVRSTFVRQAANLWAVKQILQRQLAQALGAYEAPIHLVDGFPMPVCHLARAKRGKLCRDVAMVGYCATKEEYYWGFHGHVVISRTGVITGLTVTAANVDERAALFEVIEDIHGLLIGDKGYISHGLHEELFRSQAIDLQTPLRANMIDTRAPQWVRQLVTTRRLVETVIGQLTERFHIQKVRARDLWHLTSRISRKILAHTMGVFLNTMLGREPLQFDGLIAD